MRLKCAGKFVRYRFTQFWVYFLRVCRMYLEYFRKFSTFLGKFNIFRTHFVTFFVRIDSLPGESMRALMREFAHYELFFMRALYNYGGQWKSPSATSQLAAATGTNLLALLEKFCSGRREIEKSACLQPNLHLLALKLPSQTLEQYPCSDLLQILHVSSNLRCAHGQLCQHQRAVLTMDR